MKKIAYILISTLMMSCLLAGCGGNELDIKNNLTQVEESNLPQKEVETVVNKYEKITAEQAKEIMDTESNYIILDVRSLEEYNEGHIKNAVLLPVDNIMTEAGPVIGEKDKTVLVYCRSGNRSKMASGRLAELGYTNIKDFGGIVDWPYEVVIE